MADEKQTVDMDVVKLRNAVNEAHEKLRYSHTYADRLGTVHEAYERQIQAITKGAQSTFKCGVALLWAAMILNTGIVLLVAFWVMGGR